MRRFSESYRANSQVFHDNVTLLVKQKVPAKFLQGQPENAT